jgi:hypothetical protein
MTAYKEAVQEFSNSATHFLEHLSLLSKARDAYQRAMLVSTELRNTLDAGDEAMRILMAQMQGLILQTGDDSGRKQPEPATIEEPQVAGRNAGVSVKKAAA